MANRSEIQRQGTKKETSSDTKYGGSDLAQQYKEKAEKEGRGSTETITVNTTLGQQYKAKSGGGGSSSTPVTRAPSLDQPTLIPEDVMTGKSVGEGIMTPEKFQEIAGVQPVSKMPEEFRPRKTVGVSRTTGTGQSIGEGIMTPDRFIAEAPAEQPQSFLPPLSPAEKRKEELRREIRLEQVRGQFAPKPPTIQDALNPFAPATEYGEYSQERLGSIVTPLERPKQESKKEQGYFGGLYEAGKELGGDIKGYVKEQGAGKTALRILASPVYFWGTKPSDAELQKKGEIRQDILDFGSALVPKGKETSAGYWKDVFKESSITIGKVETKRQELLTEQFEKEEKRDLEYTESRLIDIEAEKRFQYEVLGEQGTAEIQQVALKESDLKAIDIATMKEIQAEYEKSGQPEKYPAYQKMYEVTSQLRQQEAIKKNEAEQLKIIERYNILGEGISTISIQKSELLISAREEDYKKDLASYNLDIKSGGVWLKGLTSPIFIPIKPTGKVEAQKELGLKDGGFLSVSGEYVRGYTYNIVRNVASIPLDVGMMLGTGYTFSELKTDVKGLKRGFEVEPIGTTVEIAGTIALTTAVSYALGGRLTTKGAVKEISKKTPQTNIIYEDTKWELTKTGAKSKTRGTVSVRYTDSTKTIYSDYSQISSIDNNVLKSAGKTKTYTELGISKKSTFEISDTPLKVSPTGVYTGEGTLIQKARFRFQDLTQKGTFKLKYEPLTTDISELYQTTKAVKGTGFGSIEYTDLSLRIGKYQINKPLSYRTTYITQYEGLISEGDIYTGLKDYRLYKSSKMPPASEFISQEKIQTGKGLSTSMATSRMNKIYDNIAKSQIKQANLLEKSKGVMTKDILTEDLSQNLFKPIKKIKPSKPIKKPKPIIPTGTAIKIDTTYFRAGGGTEAISRANPSYDSLTGIKTVEIITPRGEIGALSTSQMLSKELGISRALESLQTGAVAKSLSIGYAGVSAGVVGTLGISKDISISPAIPISTSTSLGLSTSFPSARALSISLVEPSALSISGAVPEPATATISTDLTDSLIEPTALSEIAPITIPVTPVTQPPPYIPFFYGGLPSGALSFAIERQTRLRKQPKRYTPSILAFDIGKMIGKAPKNRGFTGFEVRGIPKGWLRNSTRGGLL